MPKREVVFGQYDLHNGGLAYMRMIRTDRYKYIRHFNAKGMDELYDLRTDPGEEKNLAGRNAKVAERLNRQLTTWMKSIEDPLLKDKY